MEKNIEKMSVESLITDINFLANEQKKRKLNPDELSYQQKLRNRYLELYKNNLRDTLKTVKVVDEYGNDITPQKLKDEKVKDHE